MRTYRRIATVAAVTLGSAVGILSLAPAAQAAPGPSCHRVHQQSGPNYGILNGTNVNVPIDADLNLTGNALALLGFAQSHGHTNTRVICGHRHY